MSEPVLRRSGRNVAKKEAVPPPPAPAAAAQPTRKRSSAEPKKPAPKKAKVKAATATATATEEAPAKNDEAAPAPAAAPSSSKVVAAAAAKAAKAALAPKTAKAKKGEAAAEGGAPAAALGDGDVLPKDLPEVQTHDGSKISLTALLEKAQKGIVIFAYPKASTPGCTTQACLFRDRFAEFSSVGYTVFGLSGDSPAANEKFKTKQNLSYTLLCDPTFELHEKFGIKKQPKGTIRSIIVIEKSADSSSPGKILKKAPATPSASLTIALQAVGIESGGSAAAAASGSATTTAAVAAEKKAEENKVPDATSTAVDAAA